MKMAGGRVYIKCMKEDIKGVKGDRMGTKPNVRRDETTGLLYFEYYVNINLNIFTLRFITLPNLLDMIIAL